MNDLGTSPAKYHGLLSFSSAAGVDLCPAPGIIAHTMEPVAHDTQGGASDTRRPPLRLWMVLGLSLALGLVGLRWGLPNQADWSVDAVDPEQIFGTYNSGFVEGWLRSYPPLHARLLAAVWAAVGLLTAAGLFAMRRWGCWLAVVYYAGTALLLILQLVDRGQGGGQVIPTVFQAGLAVLIIWYLTSPDIRPLFRKRQR